MGSEGGGAEVVRSQRVGAYAVCMRDDEILLVQYAGTQQWGLPGGGVDHGEHPLDGMVREVAEETGYTVAARSLLGVHNALWRRPGQETHSYQLVYDVEVVGGALRDEEGGSTQHAAWVRLDALGDLKQASLVGVALDLYAARPADGRSPLSELGDD